MAVMLINTDIINTDEKNMALQGVNSESDLRLRSSTHYMTLGKFLHLSESIFTHLQKRITPV